MEKVISGEKLKFMADEEKTPEQKIEEFRKEYPTANRARQKTIELQVRILKVAIKQRGKWI